MVVMREHAEVVKSLEGFVEENLDLLKSVSDSWQPSDILPDMTAEGWSEEVQRMCGQAGGVPDEVLIVLVGNTITDIDDILATGAQRSKGLGHAWTILQLLGSRL